MFKDMGRAPKATKVYKCKTQPSHHFPMWIWCGLRVNTMGVQGRNPLMWHTSHMHVSKTSYRANKATYVAQWNGTSTRTCLHKTMSKKPIIWHHLGHSWYVTQQGIAFICLLLTRILVYKIVMQPFLN